MRGPLDDREIILLLNNRDEKAVAALKERFGGLCRSLIRNVLTDERDVEECLSSVFMRLWSSIPPAEPRNLTAYVAKAARNEALMRYRANRSSGVNEILPFEEIKQGLPSVENDVEAKETARLINSFIGTLPEEKRRVFILRYWFMYPIADIAKRLSMSESKVTSMLSRLRAKLKEYLESEGIRI